MSDTTMKEDPLTRIQKEIIEVSEREREFREGHFRVNRLMSESTLDIKQNGLSNGNNGIKLNRAVSTSNLNGQKTPQNPSNGYTRRFTPQNGQKGIMQRFIASKGRFQLPSALNTSTYSSSIITTASPAVLTQQQHSVIVTRPVDFKPVRKGYVPVEEKIQKELREMKNREQELKKMRKIRRPFDLASLDLSDDDSLSESDEEDIPMPGKLKVTKSIGELYESLNDELRSPTPRSNDSFPSLKPAKSLAELCELNPGQEFLAPSSTRLIAQWESIIQQKQEAGAA